MTGDSRFAALDLGRFIAAFIVFSGHMMFLPSQIKWDNSALINFSPIRTGATAVLFFFALSGFVLTIRGSTTTYLEWTVRRLMRLYPVYITAWIAGLILVLAHDRTLLSIQTLGLGLIGFQSLSPKASLVINAPLWSLSIEIIFATFLYFLIRMRSRLMFLTFLFLIVLVFMRLFPSSPVYKPLAFFVIGVLLRNDYFTKIKMNKRIVTTVLFFVFIYYVFIGARQIISLPNSFSGELIRLSIVVGLLFLLSKVELNPTFEKVALFLGRRSFCIYAFHYPVLLFFNYFLAPSSKEFFVVYCALSLAGTLLVSELAFRLIDIPSIAHSRNRNI